MNVFTFLVVPLVSVLGMIPVALPTKVVAAMYVFTVQVVSVCPVRQMLIVLPGKAVATANAKSTAGGILVLMPRPNLTVET